MTLKRYFPTTSILKRFCYLISALFIVSTTTSAIVIRDDVPDSRYVVPKNAFPALIDLPDGGHGTLIAEQWVVTAAHSTDEFSLDEVRVNGEWHDVAQLIVYPGFKKQYAQLVKMGEPTLEKWAAIKEVVTSMHDIALVKLATSVNNVKPIALYRSSDEQGKVAKIYGKGATGNGRVGQYPNSPQRGKLRRAFNQITSGDEQWINYQFDCGTNALPLEGVMGGGDSGGPVLIKGNGEWKLAGISDWKHWPKGRSEFEDGVCGQMFSNSRISYYAEWIDCVMASHK